MPRKRKAARIDLGPANSITVTGQPGGTLTVWAHGRAVELEVAAGESVEQVARRLAGAING